MMITVQIVIVVRLLTLASLRSDALPFLRLLLMTACERITTELD